MDPPPPVVQSGVSCQEFVSILALHRTSMGLVCDSNGRLIGSVTERDVAHRMAFRVPPSTPIMELMHAPVTILRDNDYLFHAIAILRRQDLHQAAVVANTGRLCGTLLLKDALAAAIPFALDLSERLTHEATPEGLARVKEAQVELAEVLLQEQIPAPEIQVLLTHINNDIYRRLLDRAVREMTEEGWGEPPVSVDVLVMGSGGRGENFLFPDQDNGFVLGDYPPALHSSIDIYFIELAERLTTALARVGFPRCRGHVMANNPLWRKTLSEWQAQLRLWLRRPNAATLRLADIFFDFVPVYGEGNLARTLREYIRERVGRHYPFLQAMQGIQSEHRVALGLFGRLLPDATERRHRGQLNLKYHALLPLVESIRLLTLREGIAETATLARIEVLHARKFLDGNEQDYLSGAFRQLTRLVLRQQIKDFRAGLSVTAFVSPVTLSKREKDLLVAHLHAIKALQDRVRAIFSADLF
ncbi:MAG: DUF294 nucleotidyltransferase-like domain-containing protein [Gammaproteobacteria bacterium]